MRQRRPLVLMAAAGVAVAAALSLFATGDAVRAAAAPPQSQAQAGPPPTFRSDVLLVPIDIRAVDRRGNPVTDLRQDEFVITENGVRQTISQFVAFHLEPVPTPAGAGPVPKASPTSPLSSSAGPLTAPSGRVFLIVLGRGRLQYPGKGVDAVLSLVRDRLLPQDQVAVMAWNRATDFTNDHAKILAVLERLRDRHEDIEQRLDFHFFGEHTEFLTIDYPDDIQRSIEETFRGSSAVASRQVGNARQAPAAQGIGRLAEERARAQRLAAVGIESESPASVQADFGGFGKGLDEMAADQARIAQDFEKLVLGIDYLRRIEGEKHLLFITEKGLAVATDVGLAARANHARVAIHTVHVGGTDPTIVPGRTAALPAQILPTAATLSSLARLQALRELALETGGQSSSAQMAPAAVARLERATRAGYVIGYQPVRSVADRSYRRIDVKVTRPGVTVSYRHGYFADPAPPAVDRRRYYTEMRMTGAAGYGRNITDIRWRVTQATYNREPAGGTFTLGLLVEAAPLALKQTDGLWKGTLAIEMMMFDERDRLLNRGRFNIDLKLDDTRYRDYMANGVPLTLPLPARLKPLKVGLIVYDYDADLIGSSVVTVK